MKINKIRDVKNFFACRVAMELYAMQNFTPLHQNYDNYIYGKANSNKQHSYTRKLMKDYNITKSKSTRHTFEG